MNLLARIHREWQAAKRAIKRPILRWLLDRAHAALADVPREMISDVIAHSFHGNRASLRKAATEFRAILGDRLCRADVILLAELERAAADAEARMN